MEEAKLPIDGREIPLDEAPPVIEPKRDLTKLFIVGGAILFVVIVVTGLVLGVTMINRPKNTPKVSPTPTPTPPVVEITPANPKYASDSAFLKLRDDLKILGTQIDSVDLFEPQLSPPNVDLNINIK